MKKILVLAIFSCFAFLAQGQLTGGVKGAINISQLRATVSGQSESTDMMVGFQLGGYLNYPLSEKIVFQPELVLNRVGGKESEYDPDSQENVSVTFNLDYISIPLMFKFKTDKNFFFLAGPQIGLLAAAKLKVDVLGLSVSVDGKSLFQSVDFGLTGGIGYSINKVNIDARYNLGLANIAKDSGGEKLQTRVIMLSVSYKLFEK